MQLPLDLNVYLGLEVKFSFERGFIVTGFTIKFEDNKVLSLILTATRMQEMILIMKHFGSDKRLGKVLYQSDKRRRFHLFTVPQ